MKKLKSVLKEENIICGYLYFYVHFIVEVVCFYYLSKVSNSPIVWLVPFLYDAFAFVPQSIIGYFKDKNPKINFGIIGTILLFIGISIFSFIDTSKFVSLFFICFGNGFLHVEGAFNTLNVSHGKLSHPAIFVGGGSFGVITGRVLAKTMLPSWIMLIFILTMIPFIIYANTFIKKESNTLAYNYESKKVHPFIIIILAVVVVIVRGYMGYGIPTSWNKTMLQTVYLFVIMGIGKCLGGILSDLFGIRKVAILSTIFAIPFLLIGDNLMIISLLGVMFFSMTMAVTLGILVSVLKKNPSLAFGLTTIGLFLGTAPIFFIKIVNTTFNSIMIITLSMCCSLILSYIIRREE